MPVEVTCRCGQRFRAEDQLLGREVGCPMCGRPISIPAEAPRLVVACRCGARFQARADLAGRELPCPRCSQPLKIQATSLSVPATSTYDPLFGALPPATNTLPPAVMATSHPAPSARSHAPRRGATFTWENGAAWSGLLMYGIAVVGGLFFMFVWLEAMLNSLSSSGWSQTEATIVSAKLVERHGRRGKYHDAHVSYTYVVGGDQYTGSRISFMGYGASKTSEEACKKYQPGTVHPAWYDPASPQQVVLDRANNPMNILFPLVGLVFAIGGAAGCIKEGKSLYDSFQR